MHLESCTWRGIYLRAWAGYHISWPASVKPAWDKHGTTQTWYNSRLFVHHLAWYIYAGVHGMRLPWVRYLCQWWVYFKEIVPIHRPGSRNAVYTGDVPANSLSSAPNCSAILLACCLAWKCTSPGIYSTNFNLTTMLSLCCLHVLPTGSCSSNAAGAAGEAAGVRGRAPHTVGAAAAAGPRIQRWQQLQWQHCC